MTDTSFERFMSGADGQPLNPSNLAIRVLWFEQRTRYFDYLKNKSPQNLDRVFSIFGKAANIDTLRVDTKADIPFAGDMFFKTTFGKNVTVGANTLLWAHAGIGIGDGAVIGQRNLLLTMGHPVHPIQRHLHMIGPIKIGANVLLGAGTVVVNGGKVDPVTVGEGSVTLPNTIITKNIPPYHLVNGTNNVLLQGKEFFLPVDAAKAHQHVTLRSRLSEKGLAKLAELGNHGVNLEADITASAFQPQQLATTTYRETEITPNGTKDTIFKASKPSDLAICLIPSPLYIKGEVPVVLDRVTLNQGTYIETDPNSKINLNSWVLVAPMANIKAKNGGSISFDPEVWVGAGATILADGKHLKMGRGSIIVAGAVIDKDVPEWSIVGPGGKILGPVNDARKMDIPAAWTDADSYYKAFADNSKTAREMPSPERLQFLHARLSAANLKCA